MEEKVLKINLKFGKLRLRRQSIDWKPMTYDQEVLEEEEEI